MVSLAMLMLSLSQQVSATEISPEMRAASGAGEAVRGLFRSMELTHSSRRLASHQAFCWDDCGGPTYDDNATVCSKPERCSDGGAMSSTCLGDCAAKSRMEAQIMCDTKKFCVDQGAKGACPLTLGAVESTGATAVCDKCKDLTVPINAEVDKMDVNDKDFNLMALMGTFITSDWCPKIMDAAKCIVETNPECNDMKYRDTQILSFAGFCGCPCFSEFNTMMQGMEAGEWKACKKMLGDNFTTGFPGMAEAGLAMMSSGVTECLGCGDNAGVCLAAFTKYFPKETADQLAPVITMKAACTTTPSPATTTTEAPTQAPVSASDGTSFSRRSAAPLFFLVSVLIGGLTQFL